MKSERKEVELLACKLSEQPGRPAGSPDEDWLRAKRELVRAQAIDSGLTLSAVSSNSLSGRNAGWEFGAKIAIAKA
jgi:hypothetical protein